MTKYLSKKIFKLFLLFFIYSVLPASAQLICTDVNPDISGTGTYTQDIDLNNDATPDFRITGSQTGTLSMTLVQAQQIGTGNSVLCTGGGEAQALTPGTVIDGNSTTWVQMNSGNQIMALQANTLLVGPWVGATDLYLGLKLMINSNTHYGWARFSFYAPANSFTFKDYAYNAIPNQQILAGQGCGSLAYPVFSITPQLCVGSAATLVANTGTQAVTNYVWASLGGGAVFTPSNTVNTAVTFSAAGNYTVLLITVASGTVGIMSNTVEVGFTPTLTNNSPICSGETLSLSAIGGTSYAWTGPLSFTSTSPTPTISTTSINSTGPYFVLVTSAFGCTAQGITLGIVKILPSLTLSPSGGTVCTTGSGLALQVSGTSDALQWMPPTGLSTPTGSNVIAFPSANTIYTVIGTVNGCTNIATVPVNVEAPAAISMVSSSNSFCAQSHNGSPASVTITLNGANNYSTTINNSTIFASLTTGMTTILSAMPGFNSNMPVTGTASITAFNGVCSVVNAVTLTIVPNPTVVVVTPQVTICEGDFVNLSVSGGNDFIWDNTVPGLNAYTGNTVNASPTITTIFPVYASKAGCASATKQFTVNVNAKPTLSAADRTVCISSSVTLTVSGASNYQWAGPDGFFSSTANAKIPPSSSAGVKIFTVTGTDANSCLNIKTVNLYTDLCTGVYSSEKEVEFVLFPNPFKNNLFVAGIQPMKNVRVEVRDVSGKLLSDKVVSFGDNETGSLDMTALPGGVYIVSILIENETIKNYRVTKE
jgi:hypothetical protein